MAESAYRARTSFAVAGPGRRVITEGSIVSASDPAYKAHKELFQPMSEYVEQTTQAPGEVRPVQIPSEARRGQRNRAEGDPMPHVLPPEHPDSPASQFAPGQPAAGVVADDVPPEQNPAGGPKAADAPTIRHTPPEPQTPLQARQKEAAEEAAAEVEGSTSSTSSTSSTRKSSRK